MSKVLITGGAGYLGSILTIELTNAGHKVTVYDAGWYGFEGIKEVRQRVNIIQKDIRQIELDDLKGHDVVVHLAALSNDPSFDFMPTANWEMNYEATKKIVDYTAECGIDNFVFASTASVYGFEPNKLLDETSEIDPQSNYGRSKLKCEDYILEVARRTTLKPIILRMATLMGASPRMRYDLVVNAMVASAYFDGVIHVFAGGENWRPLCNVVDAAKVYVDIINRDLFADNRCEIFNVVRKNYRISELANYIKHCIMMVDNDLPIEILVDYSGQECRSYQISGKKLEERLGIKPEHGVLSTVQQLWRCFKLGEEPDYRDVINHNIKWMRALVHAEEVISKVGGVLRLKE